MIHEDAPARQERPDKGFIYKVGWSGPNPGRFSNFREFLKREVIRFKLDNELGYLLFIALAYLVGYLIALGGVQSGPLIAAGLVLIPSLIGAMFQPRFGMYLLTALAFLVPFLKRLSPNLPLGVSMDILMAMMLFGIFIRESRFRERDWKPLLHPASLVMAGWFFFCFTHGWFFLHGELSVLVGGLRSVAGLVPLYFVGLYVFRKIAGVDRLFQVWLFFGAIAMMYGLWQQLTGLANWEVDQALSLGPQADIMVSVGVFRVFSFLNDPAAFGLTMGATGITAWVLSFSPSLDRGRSAALRALALGMWVAGFFSGTRTMVVGLAVAAVFYALLTLARRGWVTLALIAALGLGLAYLPSQNPFVQRYHAALNPFETTSYVTRQANQTAMQPLVKAFSFGAGPGAIAGWVGGLSQDSPLWQYPPESGYLILAVEQGWAGLALFIILLWTLFGMGIIRYAQARSAEVKIRYEAVLVFLCFLAVTHYLQRSFTVLPLSALFFITMPLLYRMQAMNPETQ